jgi:hypothetical protein
MQCPFVYANKKRCNGYINQIKVIKANIEFVIDEKDNIKLTSLNSNYHVHLYCSKKEGHAGCHKQPPEIMKLWFNKLPDNIKMAISKLVYDTE